MYINKKEIKLGASYNFMHFLFFFSFARIGDAMHRTRHDNELIRAGAFFFQFGFLLIFKFWAKDGKKYAGAGGTRDVDRKSELAEGSVAISFLYTQRRRRRRRRSEDKTRRSLLLLQARNGPSSRRRREMKRADLISMPMGMERNETKRKKKRGKGDDDDEGSSQARLLQSKFVPRRTLRLSAAAAALVALRC